MQSEDIQILLFFLNLLAGTVKERAWGIVTANKEQEDEFGVTIRRGEDYVCLRVPFQTRRISYKSAETLFHLLIQDNNRKQKLIEAIEENEKTMAEEGHKRIETIVLRDDSI